MRLCLALMFVATLGAFGGFTAAAQDTAPAQDQQTLGDEDSPILLRADELTFDERLNLATATGNVEFSQGERILMADTVTFNRSTEVVTASGNVVLLEPSGEVIFAEFVELTDDLKEGFVERFSLLLQDESRFAAVSGTRTGGNITRLNRAVYSPCRDCAGADEPPLWQLKASSVTHDQAKQSIVYRNARMEILGLPVAYTPYLSHPDPTVERRSGFLTPGFGGSSDFGTVIEVPYFWAISEDKDLTLEPFFTTKERGVAKATYRQAFNDGLVVTTASATEDDTDGRDRFRGHFEAEARFDLTSRWRAGADIKAATDDTYLRRYGLSSEDTLTNRLFAEGFDGRNYARAEGFAFQGLRDEDVQEQIPVVAPKLDYNYVSNPTDSGLRYKFDGNFQALTRDDGADSQRISLVNTLEQPYIGPIGDVYTLRASLQTDLYNVDEVALGGGETADGLTGRIFPQLSAEWRYPWVRASGTTRQLFEPIAALIVAPNGGNSSRIPNEDSLVFQFDETNLLRPNRFSGNDRVDGGQRVAYGLRTAVFGDGGGSAEVFVGQSYNFRTDDTFAPGSGVEDNFSDIVGRLSIKPNSYLDLLYKTRIDKDSFTARRNEVGLSVGPPALNLNADYVFIKDSIEFPEREELTLNLSSQLTDEWSARIQSQHDLTSDGGVLSYGAELTYTCDCLILTAAVRRTFTRDRDVEPTDSFFIRATFKNLGQLQGQVF